VQDTDDLDVGAHGKSMASILSAQSFVQGFGRRTRRSLAGIRRCYAGVSVPTTKCARV
jgi:hypothetical protein